MVSRALVRVLLLFLLLPACKRAGSEYVVHRLVGRIEVDGVLAEAGWDRAERAGPFVRSLDGKATALSTEAKLLWDDDHLYVAFLASDANVSGAFFKDDEKLYTSNVVEIFLDASGNGSRYDEIEVAPTNALFDASFSGGPRQGMDLSWSSHARHAVHVQGTLNDSRDVDRGWTVELAIPFASLTGMPRPRPARGDRWKFNLYRLVQGPGQPGEGQAYSPPMRGDFHALDRFATLRFED
jgi:Carbohydrate family 9 binding domain-like